MTRFPKVQVGFVFVWLLSTIALYFFVPNSSQSLDWFDKFLIAGAVVLGIEAVILSGIFFHLSRR